MITVFWILFWTLLWPLGAWAIDRAIHPRTPERRIERLLAWYPPSWRREHGDALAELLRDAIEDGRDGPRLTFDVAREGVAEGLRALRHDQVEAGFLVGLGWIMFFPQGVVAAILMQFDTPRSWFLALYAGGQGGYLVAGGMAGIGLLLIDRGLRKGAGRCRPTVA